MSKGCSLCGTVCYTFSVAKDSHSPAVDRAFDILESLADHADGLTHSQISTRQHIPKSTASYLLRSLERRGYLLRESETGKYRLGLRVLELERAVLSGLTIRELALPILNWLVETGGLTAHLAILDHGQAVYVEKVDAPGFIKMDTWIGRHMDVHATSVGKALVAYLPKEEVEAILRQHGMRKRTPKTITVPSKYLAELEKVKKQGYAIDDEENNLGVRCVGVPIFNSLGEVQASVAVSGTTEQTGEDALPKVVELVREAARKISKKLGT
jgi:DNA-binding IclR family transcriptional regulator